MGQTKKEKVFIRRFNIMCDYLFRSLKWYEIWNIRF
jgi:hypothetical protein